MKRDYSERTQSSSPSPQRRRDSADFKRKQAPAAQNNTTSSTRTPANGNGPIMSSRLRHWRSPSNPVDWSKSAWSVNSSLIGCADEHSAASQPTPPPSRDNETSRNHPSKSSQEMRMTNKVRGGAFWGWENGAS